MKKMMLSAAALVVPAIFLAVQAASPIDKTHHDAKKEIRKEKRAERKSEWSHSASTLTMLQFYQDFPQAKELQWTEGFFSEAHFMDGDKARTAYYNQDDGLVGTTSDVAYQDIPAAALRKIDKEYPGYTADAAIFFDDNEYNDADMYLFSKSVEDENNYFVSLSNDSHKIILKVSMTGDVSLFKRS